jgi:hypothetical protein
VVATKDAALLQSALGEHRFTVAQIGVVGGCELTFGDLAISIDEITMRSAAIFSV